MSIEDNNLDIDRDHRDEWDKQIGRPTKYKHEYAEMARILCEGGATDIELANVFDVVESTIYAWKASQPEFSKALRVGKKVANERVANSLYRKAVGYTHKAVKVFNTQEGIQEHVYPEHIPPDATAAKFWLMNREPELWREHLKQPTEDNKPESLTDEQRLAEIDQILNKGRERAAGSSSDE